MQTLTIILASISIFFSIVLQLKIKSSRPENFALILYVYIFGPVSAILGSFFVAERFQWLLVVSSSLYLCSAFFFITKTPSWARVRIGQLFLVAASSIIFALSFTEKNEPLLKACQILSYIGLFYVFVFEPG